MRLTKRPQNKCGYCKYTWYPRGKNISKKCQNCGSDDVRKATSWTSIAIVVFLIYVFAHKEEHKNIEPATLEDYQKTESANVIHSTKPIIIENKNSSPKNNSNANNLTNQSPAAICEEQNKIFPTKNCLERQCKTEEFKHSLECSNVKQ